MDIQGLVNHITGPYDDRPTLSPTPPDHSSSESARSQLYPADVVAPGVAYPGQHRIRPRESNEQLYSPQYQPHPSGANPVANAQRESPPLKRPLPEAGNSPTSNGTPVAKRRETNGDSKVFPTRRRALQACEACRAKKSKCDNERPSCGSCIQHGIECVYKGAPFVPVYQLH
jgi:Fungal Zn(2)-Cys(6) binuclear cluster domain